MSENGAQYLGMEEQVFMTLRDQGDPLSSQTHWSKRRTASFDRIDISQLAKCTNNVRKCLVQLCTKLSQNICNTAKFVQAAFWYEERISKLVSRYDKCLNVQVTMWRSRWRCVIKLAYSVSFLLSINIVIRQNVLYFPNDLRTFIMPHLSNIYLAIVTAFQRLVYSARLNVWPHTVTRLLLCSYHCYLCYHLTVTLQAIQFSAFKGSETQ